MSSLKIPLLLAVALGMHTTMTSPNPPPPQAERLPPRGIEHVAPTWAPILLKGLFWTCTIAEITLLSTRLILPPSSPARRWITTVLDPAHGAARLRLTPLFLTGVLLTLLGAALRVYCYRTLHTFFTFELSLQREHRLITTGPYAIVRHPSYTGALLAGLGVAASTLAPGAWALECTGGLLTGRRVAVIWAVGLVGACVGIRTRMGKEDRMLKERFGREWEAWAARVPCWILPGVY
ncbi:hypothetical protein C8R46DRAFT_1088409 [Mycena filopes]|nr:hypothetical protein C8R46DRAFT_1088409 [Mycena filopes]